jgi:hypothetical protein
LKNSQDLADANVVVKFLFFRRGDPAFPIPGREFIHPIPVSRAEFQAQDPPGRFRGKEWLLRIDDTAKDVHLAWRPWHRSVHNLVPSCFVFGDENAP